MPKFLIVSKNGFFTTAVELKESDYKKADKGDIKIVLMSEHPEQYVDKNWSLIRPYPRNRGK